MRFTVACAWSCTPSLHSRNVETSCASSGNLSTLHEEEIFLFLLHTHHTRLNVLMMLRFNRLALAVFRLMHAAFRNHAKPCSDEICRGLLSMHESKYTPKYLVVTIVRLIVHVASLLPVLSKSPA